MATLTKDLCYHCGNNCASTILFKDNKAFCCTGCINVYNILSSGKLNTYYKLNPHPGTSQRKETNKFDFLAVEDIAAKLISYKDSDQTIVNFYLPAVHCSSCIWLLEHLNTLNKGILDSRLDFLKKLLCIKFDNQHTSLQAIAELLTNIGYEPLISLQDIVKKGSEKKDALTPKIAVAGFCFGNVMLLSFPAYFGLSGAEEHFGRFFSLLNLTFCLPVVFYSGWDYFERAWQSLKRGTLNIDFPLALGIAVLFIRSLADYIFNMGEGYADSLAGLVFFLLIGRFVQQKTYHHLSFERDYRSFFPVAVDVLNEERQTTPVALENIKEGDRIRVKNQEIIPADAILLRGEALIDFSFVTGESQAVAKTLGEIIYAGGRQTAGALELEVVKPVSQSYLTGLWNNEAFTKNNHNITKTFVDNVSHYFSIMLLVLAFASFILWLPQNWQTGLNAFTSILIVACPCALALSTPFTMGAALNIFDKNKFYLKSTEVVEQLAEVDSLIFDKTGTVTLPEGNSVAFNGKLSKMDEAIVYSVCKNSLHPLSRRICKHLNSEAVEIETYQETPGKGINASYRDKEIRIGSAEFVEIHTKATTTSPQVHVRIDGCYLGYFEINQQLRPQLKEVLSKLNQHYQIALLSGDSNQDKAVLQNYFQHSGEMWFKQSPQDKLNFIAKQQARGKKVLMLGDGLNDAGALQQSNAGIAVTDNINNFTPGSDAILDGSSFWLLPNFLKFSKSAVRIVHLSFCISVFYNIIGISFAIKGMLSPLIAAILMPLSTITIILFTSVATHLQAKRYQLKS